MRFYHCPCQKTQNIHLCLQLRGENHLSIKLSNAHQKYIRSLKAELRKLSELAKSARGKGLDPILKPESEIANDLAELVEGLVGPLGVAEGIREITGKLPREELAFKIAEEIVYGKFGHMETQIAAEQAIRTSLAILTEGKIKWVIVIS